MKKETLLEMILGTIGGIIFAIGMCMCLIPEWNLFKIDVIIAIIGFIVLLSIIPIYKSIHPKETHRPIKWETLFAWFIGIIGILIMGYGMSKVMVGNPNQTSELEQELLDF